MFEELSPLPADPLLGIMAACAADPNPDKVDLGVGVYKNEEGNTPIFASVKAAEAQMIEAQNSKVYIGPSGSPDFNRLLPELIYGDAGGVLKDARLAAIQTPGGCGALRVAAEFLKRVRPNATIWFSDPTWANHEPLLGDAGLKLASYPYYDQGSSRILFDQMLATLEKVPADDVVLLHGCCHNPSGADLTEDQWREVSKLAQKNGFLPFVDLAYQGFGRGLDEDAFGVRLLVEEVPELVVASSCSKNFGLYRERTGSLSVVTREARHAAAATTHLNKIVRGIYSMPPAHGAAIVETLLADSQLSAQWRQEVSEVRERMKGLRSALADALEQRLGDDRFRFIEEQQGMFSFLGISAAQVQALQERYSVYAAGSSRINVAGLNARNVDYVAQAIAGVL
ncbi:amino acid aminotransferase [Gilvimarinus sp. F26214L]|uniref:amino acid aminotransferase n=1 Tax=Gilvimarinus sp. DZF01 TaxID=3461371 RepID=UPI004045857E